MICTLFLNTILTLNVFLKEKTNIKVTLGVPRPLTWSFVGLELAAPTTHGPSFLPSVSSSLLLSNTEVL